LIATNKIEPHDNQTTKSLAILDSITRNSREGIILLDPKGTIVEFNPFAEKIFGYKAKNVLNKNIDLLIADPIKESPGNSTKNYLKGKPNTPLESEREIEGLAKNGNLIPLDICISEINAPGNNFTLLLVKDSTRQREFQSRNRMHHELIRELAEPHTSNDFLTNVLNILGDYMEGDLAIYWEFNTTTHLLTSHSIWHPPKMKISSFTTFENLNQNLAFSKGTDLPGLVMEKMEPVWIQDIASAPNFPRGSTAKLAGLNSGLAFPITCKNELFGVIEIFYAKEVKPNEETYNWLTTVGHQIGINFSRTCNEQALTLAKEEAEKSNFEKSQFLANMSHEIRTPLNIILGMSEVLSETALTEHQEHLVQTSIKSGDNLLYLINSILDLARIEAGEISLEQMDFNLKAFLSDTLSMWDERENLEQVELAFDIDPDVKENVRGDSHRIAQILINLIGNAFKFTEKGHIHLTVKNDLSINNKSNLQFAISDTGIGVPADKQKSIFEKFSQADLSDTRKYGGTGLGLAITQKLVHLMGGDIWVESEVGKGSTFIFNLQFDESLTIPVKNFNGTQTPVKKILIKEDDIHQNDKESLRILMVEDCPDNVLLVQMYLNKLPHEMTMAENGQIAVEKFLNEKYDLVLMDMQMPVMDGYAATRKIRQWEKENGKEETPIIALTASALIRAKERCLSAGCTKYMSKPVKKAKLLEEIAKYQKTKPVSIT